MHMSFNSIQRGAAVVVAATIAVGQPLPARAARQATQAAARPVTQQVGDPGWPRAYSTPSEGQIIVYQPQAASWKDQKTLVAYAAVSYQPKGSTAQSKPMLGTITLEADTNVSMAERLVHFENIRITDTHFENLPKDQMREVVARITDAIPKEDRVIALDRVLSAIDKSKIIPKNVPGLKSDPPTIFFSQTPAVLVAFDGEPVWSPIDKNDLKFAVNTNWDAFEHQPTKTF